MSTLDDEEDVRWNPTQSSAGFWSPPSATRSCDEVTISELATELVKREDIRTQWLTDYREGLEGLLDDNDVSPYVEHWPGGMFLVRPPKGLVEVVVDLVDKLKATIASKDELSETLKARIAVLTDALEESRLKEG